MSPAIIIWTTFLFGAVVGGIAATVILCAVMINRGIEHPTFSPEDLARMVERAK